MVHTSPSGTDELRANLVTGPMRYLENDAVISDCKHYRYLLRRTWDFKRPRALLVMLNPSTADASTDDPTIRSCVRLLKALGYGSLEVVNLFAWRATDPSELFSSGTIDYVGPDNDATISLANTRANIAICAWGAHHSAEWRVPSFMKALQGWQEIAVYCFGKTKAGHPKHPLYIKTGTPLETYP